MISKFSQLNKFVTSIFLSIAWLVFVQFPSKAYCFMPDETIRVFATLGTEGKHHFFNRYLAWVNFRWLPENLPVPTGRTHKSITKVAILGDEVSAYPSIRETNLEIPAITKEMEKAADQIYWGNGCVDIRDLAGSDPTNHFDNEHFASSINRIKVQVEKIGMAINNTNQADRNLKTLFKNENYVETGREELGNALHTVQDFYSHSSWVDGRNTVPITSRALKWPFDSPLELAGYPGTQWTCASDQGYRENLYILTSGWYHDPPPIPFAPIAHKCVHGGPGDSLNDLGIQQINKDTTTDEWSPIGLVHHDNAADSATIATREFILSIGDFLSHEDPLNGVQKFRFLLGVEGILLTNESASNSGSYSITFNDVGLPVNCEKPSTCTVDCFLADCNETINLEPSESMIISHPATAPLSVATLHVRGEEMHPYGDPRRNFTINLPPGWEFINGVQNTNQGLIPINDINGQQEHWDVFIYAPSPGFIHVSNTYTIIKTRIFDSELFAERLAGCF